MEMVLLDFKAKSNFLLFLIEFYPNGFKYLTSEPIDEMMAMEKGANQAIPISQSFLMKDKLRFSTLSDSLRARNIGNPSTNEDGFKGNLRADVETV